MDISTPTISEFDPRVINFQYQLIKDVRTKFDYSEGKVHEILCSGSAGSSKSLVGAHLVVSHCLFNPNARVLIGRKSMPALKDTILRKITDHLGDDVEYVHNKQRGIITFPNGSEIIPYSWGDSNLMKVRSLELSCALIEELTENENMDFYKEIRMRVGRLPHVKEAFVLSLTNPGDPGSEFYKYFINPGGKQRHVYYSLTSDNIFLPKGYIEGLKESLSEREAERMIYGRWVPLTTDIIYYAYDPAKNLVDKDYVIDKRYPVRMLYDFNIALGKPLSLAFGQYITDKDTWHFFDEVICDGQRTLDSLEIASDRGLLDINNFYIIHGDAAGRSRDTRSIRSDYDIIENYLSNYTVAGKKLQFRIDVPRANPPVRARHNIVNAYCQNAKGSVKLFVYRKAKTVDEGLRLTKLKSNGSYLEDDSDRWQHVTTAIGYGIVWEHNKNLYAGPSMSQGRY